MRYNNYEATLKSFPHWYDKSPSSNFSKVIKVFNNQYLDKYHKIRTLDFAQRLYKPIRIHKEQEDKYKYNIVFEVFLPNLKTVNIYINPTLNDDEEIISYEKCLTKEYKDDGHNDSFNYRYDGDTRKTWKSNAKVGLGNIDWSEYEERTGGLTVNVVADDGNNNIIPLENANITVKDITPIIPKDTFVIEVLTYDDYRWVKGFPENDATDLFRIYQETKSYTDYLTFEIRKQNIKSISILKDNIPLYEQDLFSQTRTQDPVIYHDYIPMKEVGVNKNENVLIADPNGENYIVQVILKDDDYEIVFDYSNIKLEYPNEEDYIKEFLTTAPVIASEETMGKVVIRKRNNKYTAYKTVKTGDNYAFAVLEQSIRHTRVLKSNFDLFLTVYDKNNPNCPDYDKTIHKRYNGFDKHNYDCFTHDYSLDMLGKWWNVPRLDFNPTAYENTCEKLNVEYYRNTYPSFNERLSEDDYSYQERMTRYIQGYNKDYFPVLELWKTYQVWGELRNRKDILSVQNKSYIQEYPYYEDTSITEESGNKLKIITGVGNPVSIDNHEWYETVIVDNLFIVPKTEYHFKCIFKTKARNIQQGRNTIHLYYLDKVGNCTNEKLIEPTLHYKERNGLNEDVFLIDEKFITNENSVKLDIVLEADFQYSFENAVLRKVNIADKGAMYMTTKNDYNSCTYDLTVNYGEVPTNIVFNNTKEFEKLLQRSLPITHKGFLNIKDDYTEQLGLSSGFGNITLVNLFDYTNNNGQNQHIYQLEIDNLITEGYNYTLNVDFINEEVNEGDDYILTSLLFKETYDGEPLSYDPTPIMTEIEPYSTTNLTYNFIPPEGARILVLTFETETTNFKYDELKINRTEPITTTELWSN